MQLYYCDCRGVANFGDQLNRWLWPKVLPDLFDDDSEVLFLGIGTILNDRLPRATSYIVAGSGVGYGQLPPIDERWDIQFVRGPVTAAAIGADVSLAITDPAVLVRRFYSGVRGHASSRISFMPHYATERKGRWSELAGEVGLSVIDATADCDTVIAEIASSTMLVTDAMHGAIVADALRVPWVPFTAYSHSVETKWRDWCSSVELEYRPHRLPALWSPRGLGGRSASMRWWGKRLIAKTQLKRLLRQARPQLSDDRVLESRITRIEEKLHVLRKTWTPTGIA